MTKPRAREREHATLNRNPCLRPTIPPLGTDRIFSVLVNDPAKNACTCRAYPPGLYKNESHPFTKSGSPSLLPVRRSIETVNHAGGKQPQRICVKIQAGTFKGAGRKSFVKEQLRGDACMGHRGQKLGKSLSYIQRLPPIGRNRPHDSDLSPSPTYVRAELGIAPDHGRGAFEERRECYASG